MKGKILSLSFFLLTLAQAGAQPVDSVRIPLGQPSMLEFNPDARTAAMGYAGAALSSDANATYINASKLAVAKEDFGASVSYTPWLPKLVDGMWLGYASAYKKLGEKQAVAASVQYFDYDVYTTGGAGNRAHDIAISGMYSRQLGRNFSMGLALKYINSDWGQGVVAGNSIKPGRAMAADISAFYRKRLKDESTGRDVSWSFGAVLANIGDKIDYGVGGGQYFLPAKLRIGGGISYSATGRHRFNLIADASKLLVPTPVGGSITSSQKSFDAIFKSFSDAPGGFKEEMQEIMIGAGAEYWYNDVVALRAGYYNEDKRKAGFKAFTAGAGARIFKKYQADFSYLLPVSKGSPFEGIYRATLSFYLNEKRG